MPSVHQLRERVQSLGEAVSRQREVLRDLEKQSSTAQTELNASLDPMARLPLEISSSILSQSLPEPTTWEALLALTSVSNAWRDIALATLSLWSSVSDQGIRPPRFPDLLEIWVARGQRLPFSLSLRHMTSTALDRTFVALEKHANRVEKLDLWLGLGYSVGPECTLVTLKSLTIDGDAAEKQWSFHITAILTLLRNAPNLVEFNFLCPKLIHSSKIQPLTHPNLRHLRLGQLNNVYSRIALLRFLQLPSLETLSIFGHVEHDLPDFLRTSIPPLLWPSLTDLEVIFPQGNRSTIFDTLSNPDIVPQLRNLAVLENAGTIENWEQHVLTFLATPRPAFESLSLRIPKYSYDKLTEDFVAAVHAYEAGPLRVSLELAES